MKSNSSVEITFFIPCYNEEANVTGALDTVKKITQGKNFSYEIIVVDDGSADKTSVVVKSYCAAHPQMLITFHRNSTNRGLGYNYIRAATDSQGRYYLLINGDNDIPPEDLTAILEHRGAADLIIPYVHNDKRPFFRQVVSRTFTAVVNFISGHQLRYYNGPVLHLRENVIRFNPKAKGFAYQAELICRALTSGCTYIELPFRSLAEDKGLTSAFRFSNLLSVFGSLSRIAINRITACFSK